MYTYLYFVEVQQIAIEHLPSQENYHEIMTLPFLLLAKWILFFPGKTKKHRIHGTGIYLPTFTIEIIQM